MEVSNHLFQNYALRFKSNIYNLRKIDKTLFQSVKLFMQDPQQPTAEKRSS